MRTPAPVITSLLIAGLAGCGAPGAPLPPSLGIPKPITDLHAVRKGEVVTLTWSAPEETNDGELLRKPGTMVVSRILPGQAGTGASATIVATVPLEPALKGQPAPTASDSLAAVLRVPSGDFARYSVVARSSSGKYAGESNQASVPLVPTPAAPSQLQLATVPQGVALRWDQAWPAQNRSGLAAQYAFRIMRREQGAKSPPVMIAQFNSGNEAMAFVDIGIEWQKHYDYWITPVTHWKSDNEKGEIEGEDSPVVTIFANDTFPPAVPTGVQAVASGLVQRPFIDVTWVPNTDSDLAGYNIFRRTGAERPSKINSNLLPTPSFRDEKVSPGTRYFYSVSAVDLRNNESERSVEAFETVLEQEKNE